MIATTWINGLTNTYKLINGIIQSNAYLLTESYSRIVTPIGSYEFDITFGSYIPSWIDTRKPITENAVKLELVRCLQPMINSGRATSILVQIDKLIPQAVWFTIKIYDATNQNGYKLSSNYTKV